MTRLTEPWQDELKAFAGRDLSDVDYVYWWADGVHFNIRLDQARRACWSSLGVRPDGTKELMAMDRGLSGVDRRWANLLR